MLVLSKRAEGNFLGIKPKIEYSKIKDDAQFLVSIKLFDKKSIIITKQHSNI